MRPAKNRQIPDRSKTATFMIFGLRTQRFNIDENFRSVFIPVVILIGEWVVVMLRLSDFYISFCKKLFNSYQPEISMISQPVIGCRKRNSFTWKYIIEVDDLLFQNLVLFSVIP